MSDRETSAEVRTLRTEVTQRLDKFDARLRDIERGGVSPATAAQLRALDGRISRLERLAEKGGSK